MPKVPEFLNPYQEQIKHQLIIGAFRIGVAFMAVGSADLIVDAINANNTFLRLHPNPISSRSYNYNLNLKKQYEEMIIKDVVHHHLSEAEELAQSPNYKAALTLINNYQTQENDRNRVNTEYHGSFSFPQLGSTFFFIGFLESVTTAGLWYKRKRR